MNYKAPAMRQHPGAWHTKGTSYASSVYHGTLDVPYRSPLMGKRANGEGTIFQEKSGQWVAKFYVTVDGERRRLIRRAKTQREVLERVEDVKREIMPGATGSAWPSYLKPSDVPERIRQGICAQERKRIARWLASALRRSVAASTVGKRRRQALRELAEMIRQGDLHAERIASIVSLLVYLDPATSRERYPTQRPSVSRRLRLQVIERDGCRCRYCGVELQKADIVVDHVIPVKLGGGDELVNLVVCCRACNQRKHASLPWDRVMPFLPLISEKGPSHTAETVEDYYWTRVVRKAGRNARPAHFLWKP